MPRRGYPMEHRFSLYRTHITVLILTFLNKNIAFTDYLFSYFAASTVTHKWKKTLLYR